MLLINVRQFDSQEKFLELIQQSLPDYTATTVNPQPFGAIYAVESRPKNNTKERMYTRFLLTKHALIRLDTEDEHENRREKFFSSIKIQ